MEKYLQVSEIIDKVKNSNNQLDKSKLDGLIDKSNVKASIKDTLKKAKSLDELKRKLINSNWLIRPIFEALDNQGA